MRKPLDRALRSGHPWLYRDALEAHELPPGTAIRIASKDGKVLGCGLTESGPIGVRVWTTTDAPIDRALIAERVREALALRSRVIPPSTNAYRLLHGEGDRMPGVVCDRYDSVAVLKLDGESSSALLAPLLEVLREQLPALGVTTLLRRVSRTQRKQQALATEASLRGAEQPTEPGSAQLEWGTLPAQPMVVLENGMKLAVDVVHGQKTGLFLDQREARARVRSLGREASVLNLYGYTGGFSAAAALGGARAVTTVDVAAPALALAEQTFALNELPAGLHTTAAADVHEWLADRRDRFDLVIADPPNFAPSEAALGAALASYANLHALALAVVARGGYYMAGSCSSHVDAAAFLETLRAGAQRARRIVQILDQHGAPPDHPRLLAFPEGDYLKVVLARVW